MSIEIDAHVAISSCRPPAARALGAGLWDGDRQCSYGQRQRYCEMPSICH
jgi:hypothetical protein